MTDGDRLGFAVRNHAPLYFPHHQDFSSQQAVMFR